MTPTISSPDGQFLEQSGKAKPADVTQEPADRYNWSQLGPMQALYQFSKYELCEKEPSQKLERSPKDFSAYGDGARGISANLLLRRAKLLEARPASYVTPVSVRRLNKSASKRQLGAWSGDVLEPRMGIARRGSRAGKRGEG
jgi:hypothetical protein